MLIQIGFFLFFYIIQTNTFCHLKSNTTEKAYTFNTANHICTIWPVNKISVSLLRCECLQVSKPINYLLLIKEGQYLYLDSEFILKFALLQYLRKDPKPFFRNLNMAPNSRHQHLLNSAFVCVTGTLQFLYLQPGLQIVSYQGMGTMLVCVCKCSDIILQNDCHYIMLAQRLGVIVVCKERKIQYNFPNLLSGNLEM